MRRTPERRQEEALVLGVRVLPDQEAGALDVVGIAEADQQAIAVRRVGRRAGAPRPRSVIVEHPLAQPVVPVGELHAHGEAGVAAGVALLDAARDRVGRETRRLRLRGQERRGGERTGAAGEAGQVGEGHRKNGANALFPIM